MKTHSEQLAALGFTIDSGTPRPFKTKEWNAVAFPVTLFYQGNPVLRTDFKYGTGNFDKSGELSLDECCAIAKRESLTPELSDVMQSLILDGEAYFTSGTFSQWCDDTGYSDDSIKAKSIFDECVKIGKALSGEIPSNILDAVRAILQDF